MPANRTDLASGFPEPDLAAWHAMVDRVVGRTDGAASLARRTYDGIALRPLYVREDQPAADTLPGTPPYLRGFRALAQRPERWDIRQLVRHPDPLSAGRLAREEIEQGADSVLLRVDDLLPGSDSPGGAVVYDVGDWSAVVAGLGGRLRGLEIDAGWRYGAVASLVAAWAEREGLALGELGLVIDMDPLGAAARGIALAAEPSLERAAELVGWSAECAPRLFRFLADGHIYHGGGASSAQEIAAAMATATAYLRCLERAGTRPEEALRQGRIAFRFAVDADVFGSITKLRAARLVWHRIATACGGRPDATHIHAFSAERMAARREVHVNLLRGTAACFAAAAGGADAITVLPYDHALGQPTELARRLARNTQLILHAEGHLARVADPAGGSWFAESHTKTLAREAWSLFQMVESGGGIADMLLKGTVQGWIAETWAARAANIARRHDPLTGVSEFPDLEGETPAPEPFDPAELVAGTRAKLAHAFDTREVSFADVVAAAARGGTPFFQGPVASYTPVAQHRLGEAFEALRDRSDAWLARTGSRPRALLVRLGRPAQFTARAGFAANLLAAGGIACELTGFPGEAANFTQVAAGTGSPLAILCSSDEVYAELGAAAARTLADAGVGCIWAAGSPPEETRAALQAVGIERFLAADDDMVEVLKQAWAFFGEPP